jgi:hypothetical protein
MATSGRITLAVLSTKLDQLIKLHEDQLKDFKEHRTKDDEFYIKVDRLEQSEISRSKHLWAIYPGIVIAALINFFGWK